MMRGRAILRLVAIAALGLLASATAYAGDPPRLTPADGYLLDLCGRAGADRVDGLPFVRYGNGSTSGGVAETSLGFLVREDVETYLAVGIDLRGWPRKKTGPDEPRSDRVAYERVDLAEFVAAALAARDAGERPSYGNHTEPATPLTLLTPASWELLVLARACLAVRREDLAKRLVDWARADAPLYVKDLRPRRERAVHVLNPDNAALVTLLADDRWIAILESFPDPALSYADVTAAVERWKSLFAAVESPEADATLSTLRMMLAEEEEQRRRAPRRPESLELSERINELIYQLRYLHRGYDDTGVSYERGASPSDGTAAPPCDKALIELGRAAVPRLIEHIDDDRFTRSSWQSMGGGSKYDGGPDPVLRVGDLVWMVLLEISGGGVAERSDAEFPDVGAATRVRLSASARRWFESTAGRTESDVLAEAILRGGRAGRSAAERLVKVDPAAAVPAIARLLRENRQADWDEGALVPMLDRIDTEPARAAILGLLDPACSRLVRAKTATMLAERGQVVAIDAVIVLWDDVATTGQATFMAPDRPEALLDALIDSAEPRAIDAVARRLPEYAPDVRVAAALYAFGGRDRFFTETEAARIPKRTAASEVAIDALFAGLLEDEGVGMGSSVVLDGAVLGDPVVGEVAAFALSRRHADRWSFDVRAGPAERARERLRAANAWRAVEGKPPLPVPEILAAPPPRPFPELSYIIDLAASAATEGERATARAGLETTGLAAVDALRTGLESAPLTAPGRKDLEALASRLALTVVDAVVTRDSIAPGQAMQTKLAALRGRRFDEALWLGVIDAYLDDHPADALTLRLFAERERAGGGVVLHVTLLAGDLAVSGSGGWDGLLPNVRRGGKSTGFGQASVGSAAGRHGCAVFSSGIDAALEGIRPDEAFSVSGELRIRK